MVIERVLKQPVIFANGRAFILEAHDDRFGRVDVKEVEHLQKHVFKRVSSVTIGVVYVKLVIFEARSDIEVADTGVQLDGQVQVLALQTIRSNVMRHGIMCTGDAEAGNFDIVGYALHPRSMRMELCVEAVRAVIAMITGTADHAGRYPGEKVVGRADEDEGTDQERRESARQPY
jgi:hypothetical protein